MYMYMYMLHVGHTHSTRSGRLAHSHRKHAVSANTDFTTYSHMQLNVKETRTANHFYVLASVSRAAQARRIVFVRCVRARVRAKDVLVQVMHCTAECSKVIRLSPAPSP